MDLDVQVASDRHLARLLQIGVVLEEVVESRAVHHIDSLPPESRAAVDEAVIDLLEEAAEESADHRERLETLIDELGAETVPYEEINALVSERYGPPADTDGVLYDQLCNEETAYKFYDDLIAAIEAAEVDFGIDRSVLIETLAGIREEEREGAEEVAELMEGRT